MPNMIKCALQFDKVIKNKWNLQAEQNNSERHQSYLFERSALNTW